VVWRWLYFGQHWPLPGKLTRRQWGALTSSLRFSDPRYIASGWDTLTRSMNDCHTIVDPKLNETSILYLPAHFPAPASVQEAQKRCKIRVEELPVAITGPGQVTNASVHRDALP